MELFLRKVIHPQARDNYRVTLKDEGEEIADCMRQFRAAWDRFSADPARLSEFLEAKRRRL
jgi:hypothetical protein